MAKQVALQHLADGNSIFVGVEGADDAAEGWERRKGVERYNCGDSVADFIERGWLEDDEIVEVGDQKCV